MKDKLFFDNRSSLFVSTGALAVFAALTAVCAVLHMTLLCAAFGFFFLFCLCARIWGEHALQNVSMTCEGSPAALFPPGEVQMQIHIKNEKAMPLVWLEIVMPLEEDAPLVPADSSEIYHVSSLLPDPDQPTRFLYKKFTFLMGQESLSWVNVWHANHRGIFRPSQLRLQAGDGFGLVQSVRISEARAGRCIAVYPALQPVVIDAFLRDMWDAVSGAKGHLEDPTVIKSTRSYQSSDPYKRINWRVTARTQQTVVNTFETISPKSAHFIVDCESFNDIVPEADAFEDMLSVLASLLLELDRAGIRCSVSLPQGHTSLPQTLFHPEHTPLEDILFALAGYQLRDKIVPENTDLKPYTLPSVFLADSILTLRDVGRFYYLCSRPDRINTAALLSRLDSSRTVILPYALSDFSQSASLGEYAVMPLSSVKKGGGTYGA